jgi:hypothetical protein
MKMRVLALMLTFAILTSTTLEASVPRGDWSKMDGQLPGTWIHIQMKNREKIYGQLKSVDPDSVVLIPSPGTGSVRTLSKSDIKEIVGNPVSGNPRRRLNGESAVGLVLVGGGIAAATAGTAVCRNNSAKEGQCLLLIPPLAIAGTFAAWAVLIPVGAIISKVKGHEVLYRAR